MEQAFDANDDSVDAEAQRGASRDSMFLQAELRRLDAADLIALIRIRNLSAGGLMADCTDLTVAGERVAVDLRGIGEVGGRVAWVRPGRVGVAFDTPIEPQKARRHVSAARPAPAPTFKPRRPGLKLG